MIRPDKLDELNQAEEPAKELLRRLGYTYVPREILAEERDNERDVLLKGRLTAALLRLNPWMSEQDAERVIFNLENVGAVGIARNQRIHEYLTYGMPLDVEDGSGIRTRIVSFFDFDDPDPDVGRNEFVVTTQMRVRRGNEKAGGSDDDEKVVKPDLVLFANGIPLVVMEAKAPTLMEVWKSRAVRQLRRYQEAGPEWHGSGAPRLFDYNLMCVAHCGADAAYGPLAAPETSYVGWKSVLPYTQEEARQRFGFAPKGQAQLIIGLLNPATLLDVLRDFVTFELSGGKLTKKLPRYQQHRAVTRSLDRILKHEKPEERGGVIWHTQGSGKSLTMLWTAIKLHREPTLPNPTIAVVTDRTQLDRQISDTFDRSGFPAPERAKSSRHLRELLTSSTGRTIMTTLQKFEDVLKTHNGTLQTLNPAENVFVMVDEAHRTQYGLLAARMRKALPGATFIGFTGTPIDKGFKRSTMREFGPLIDSYTIPESVDDGVTVPIYYEARLPELSIQGPNTVDKLFDTVFAVESEAVREHIKRRYANKEMLAEAERRIQMIALDIADHYKKHVRPNGYKAQVVAPSRRAALKYAGYLNEFGVEAYPIITTTNEDPEEEFKPAKDLDQGQVISQFTDENGKPEALVVVDMLLTGFDAPVEQVLYMDKSLKDHGLLQAIARVNRRCNVTLNGVTSEKTYGLVVDYYGVSRELEAALAIFEQRDTEDAMRPLEEDPSLVIESAAIRGEGHFKGRDLNDTWACVGLFVEMYGDKETFKADLYERFDRDYKEFARLMDQYLPDAGALAYVDRLARLTKVRAYVRAQYLREDAGVDWTAVSAKVKQLIDSRIDAEVRELMKPVSILDQDFEAKISGLPHDEARASIMEHAIRAQIKDRFDENPVFYERLSEKLARIIKEMRQKVIDAAQAVKQLALLKDEALSESVIAAEQGLSEVSYAVYELLTQVSGDGATPTVREDQLREDGTSYQTSFDKELKGVALRVEAIIKRHRSIVDWHLREDVQRRMRRDIKRELRETGDLSESELDELARNMVEIARRRS